MTRLTGRAVLCIVCVSVGGGTKYSWERFAQRLLHEWKTGADDTHIGFDQRPYASRDEIVCDVR